MNPQTSTYCPKFPGVSGMKMPVFGFFEGVNYPFGFGGQMKDNEPYGDGNAYTAMFWEYDSRLGRRWNRDPNSIFGFSEYSCFSNNPILLIDPLGDKDSSTTNKPVSTGFVSPIAPATPTSAEKPNPLAYNCHSFTWDNGNGSPTDPENVDLIQFGMTHWDNNPENNTQGYKIIPFNEPNKVGDKIIYYAPVIQYDENGIPKKDKNGNFIYKVEPTHSAIVTKVDKNGNTIEVVSKWGEGGLFKHHPRDVDPTYSCDAPSFIFQGKTYPSRVYYRSTTKNMNSTDIDWLIYNCTMMTLITNYKTGQDNLKPPKKLISQGGKIIIIK